MGEKSSKKPLKPLIFGYSLCSWSLQIRILPHNVHFAFYLVPKQNVNYAKYEFAMSKNTTSGQKLEASIMDFWRTFRA